MKQLFVSDIINSGDKGHENYNFVNVNVYQDTELFLDPILIKTGNDKFSKECYALIDSFRETLFKAYKTKDDALKRGLCTHACEQNGTHLGYGNGNNGRGNSEEGLLKTFENLEELLEKIDNISEIEDLSVFIPEFAEDRLSDLLTNILHDKLNQFTLKELGRYGVKSNAKIHFWTWDLNECRWIEVERDSYCVNGKELILVPKAFVRQRNLFNNENYYRMTILEYLVKKWRYETGDDKITKNDIISAKRYSGKNWMYKEAISYTEKNNEYLEEYHDKLPRLYRNAGLSDEELDKYVVDKK